MTEKQIVYGTDLGDVYLTFVPEPLARELGEVHRGLASARTWGELRQTLTPEVFAEAEQQVDDEGSGVPDDTPFNREELGSFQDGDWPLWPTQHQLAWMPEDVQQLGALTGNMINGEWLEFPLDREGEIVAALGHHGYSVRKDVQLVRAASGIGSSRG